MPTYKEAGVDLDRADSLIDQIAHIQSKSQSAVGPSLFEAFGQFASSFDLSDYENPVLVTTCDGVGTKILLQKRFDRLETAGEDLVAMNVNDILTTGAEPILFLDYVAMSPLEDEVILPLVEGMARGCEKANCLLAGGETAELPDMMEPGDVEVSGFCAGAGEKERMRQTGSVQEGDQLLGFPSTGFHANGFSLVRKVLRDNEQEFDREEIVSLMEPTRIYYDTVNSIHESGIIPKGMVHVTGGGIKDNLRRVVPDSLGASLRIPEWQEPTIKKILSYVDTEEAVQTFNMGIGWILVLDPDDSRSIRDQFDEAIHIGEIDADSHEITIDIH